MAYEYVSFPAVISDSKGEDERPQKQKGRNHTQKLPHEDKVISIVEKEIIHDFIDIGNTNGTYKRRLQLSYSII